MTPIQLPAAAYYTETHNASFKRFDFEQWIRVDGEYARAGRAAMQASLQGERLPGTKHPGSGAP
eukprot:CAMPEP_0183364470 /NCGR_PEP_ID=MMETSP0164_2-20130417/80281_1 /TAXON_ID=221442 /ORGANISM="Coccolithus pelagicus ssp braarudi, Strain PLY182g" /LENGTH=63 /DNA_ID=CAMNT_0025539775 /DNA_START=50 /DNA_END=237 /DNA_ORIENTATION=-